MQLADSKNAKVDLTPDGIFTFSASAGSKDQLYESKLELFDKVNVEVRRTFVNAFHVSPTTVHVLSASVF